ncbi:MAG: hypothetical protein OJF50_006381 [Nitrospira sp.]|jgi:hypothetical protein|nr:hypothetical protein [Nitrospira sp.]
MKALNMIYKFRSIWLTVIFCLAQAVASYADTVFSENYEVTSINDLKSRGWEVSNSTDLNGTPVLSIVPAPSGRSGKVLRMQYQGVHIDDNHNASISRNFPGVPELYERYFVRFDAIDPGQSSGFSNITAKQHYWNVGVAPNIVTNFFWNDNRMGMTNQTAVMHTCPNGQSDTTCNLTANQATVKMTYGVWRCVEVHAGQSSADMWIDGVQVLHYEKPYWIAPSAWNFIHVYRQGADNQYRYEDDFVVSTTRIGCSGSPSITGGTTTTPPPASPTGLIVQ